MPDPLPETPLDPYWVPVNLGPRSYQVCIGRGVLSSIGNAIAALSPGAKAVAFITDANVPACFTDAAAAEVSARCRVASLSIHASEPDKSVETLEQCLRFLTHHRIERTDLIVAIGGGIVGDVAGFAAAVYRRGVPVLQCPSTLLAMVDASVGGKTGINLRAHDGTLLKNMAGAFHQPIAVLADLALLDSLSPREFRAGLAEMIKHAVIAPPLSRLWQSTLSFIERTPSPSNPALADLIRRNVELKASLVADDEREEKPASKGGRALLNLGHTFGHAIETLPDAAPAGAPSESPLTHGEAVALGMVAAARTAVSLRLFSGSDSAALIGAIKQAGLPIAATGLPSAWAIWDRMLDDKKASGGDVRLVLPHAFGDVRVVEHFGSLAARTALVGIGALP